MGSSKSEQSLQIELRTERLCLRPVVRDDLEVLAELANDKLIHAFTRTMPYPYKYSDAEKFYETAEKGWKTGEIAVFAIICDELTSKKRGFIGVVGLHLSVENQHAELGYWIGEAFRGRGFATEAAQRAVEFGFDELALRRIHASYLLNNPGSCQVLMKIGMKKEGVMRQHARKLGVFQDVGFCGILVEEFEAVRDMRAVRH